MIRSFLLRVTSVGPREREFADQLAAYGSLHVVYVADGRNGPVPNEVRPIIAVNDGECVRLGLHLTNDYAWRCGDYGVYLARDRFPDASAFWIIEGDVRLSGVSPKQFFCAMKSNPADLLASYLQPAPMYWFWTKYGAGRGVMPYQCLFCAVRISARLADVLLEKRRQHSRSLWRTALWPNDEVFVATTAMEGKFITADLNSVEETWYRTDRFGYNVTLDGDDLPDDDEAQLLHSVRWGSEVINRVVHPVVRWGNRQRIAKRIAPYLRW